MRRASLIARARILLVGVGALALVRPWGLRLPRRLVVVPVLAGSAYAAAHALTAYVTKPLHLLGVVTCSSRAGRSAMRPPSSSGTCSSTSRGSRGSGSSSRWVPCTAIARPGGSTREERLLLVLTAAATLALTAAAYAMVVARNP